MKEHLKAPANYVRASTSLAGYMLAKLITDDGLGIPPFFSLLISFAVGVVVSVALEGYVWGRPKFTASWTDQNNAPRPSGDVTLPGENSFATKLYFLNVSCDRMSVLGRKAMLRLIQDGGLWIEIRMSPGSWLIINTERAHPNQPRPREDLDSYRVCIGSAGEVAEGATVRVNTRWSSAETEGSTRVKLSYGVVVPAGTGRPLLSKYLASYAAVQSDTKELQVMGMVDR